MAGEGGAGEGREFGHKIIKCGERCGGHWISRAGVEGEFEWRVRQTQEATVGEQDRTRKRDKRDKGADKISLSYWQYCSHFGWGFSLHTLNEFLRVICCFHDCTAHTAHSSFTGLYITTYSACMYYVRRLHFFVKCNPYKF